MFMLITGGAGSGKTWIAQGFQEKMKAEGSIIILDCVAELLGRKMETQTSSMVIEEVLEDIAKLEEQTDHLIVITNEVFSDVPKEEKQQKFAEYLGRINQALVQRADIFIEVVYGIPIWRKQSSKRGVTI